jgi:hypothetical protein
MASRCYSGGTQRCFDTGFHSVPKAFIDTIMRELNESELKTWLALHSLSRGTHTPEQIRTDDLVPIIGLHRTNVVKARKRLEARGLIPPLSTSAQAVENAERQRSGIPGTMSASAQPTEHQCSEMHGNTLDYG